MAYNRLLQHFTSSQDLTKIWASSQNYIVNDLVVYTPSNKIYRCLIAHTSSGSFFTDLAAGDWVEIAASAAGTKNYITYGTFENNDANTGWSLARSTLDATTKLPNQAAGSWTAAAGTLSKSIVSSGQLAGSYSLSLASSAATTAGDMLVTSALTLDLEAQSSVQTFSFFYRVVSGASNGNFSGTSSNSVGVAIYVVDGTLAGTWIQPAGVWTVNTASSVTAITAKATGTFQVPSDATQVRLAVYFPNATTGAITLYLDDFVLGPQTVQYGAPVTDWVDYTPTGTWNTNVTYNGKWRRVGDSMEIRARVLCSGAPNAVGLGINLPSGYSIDTNKLASVLAGGTPLGYGQAVDVGSASYPVSLLYFGSTTQLGVYDGVASGTYLVNTNVSNTAPFTFGATDFVEIISMVPILGWSSTVQMSNDTDTRVVAAKFYRTSATATLTALTDTVIPWTVAEVDTHNGWDTSATYTVPVSGVYKISGNVCYTLGASAQQVQTKIYIDGALTDIPSITNAVASAVNVSCPFSTLKKLNAGQTIRIYAYASGSGTVVTSDVNKLTQVSIERLSGPSAIAATETVALKYKNTAGTTLGATATIPFATRVYDTHGAYNGTVFTAPISGTYLVNTSLGPNSVLLSTTQGQSITYKVTSTPEGLSAYQSGVFIRYGNGANTDAIISASKMYKLNAGDTIEIQAASSVAVTLALATEVNTVQIVRVGN